MKYCFASPILILLLATAIVAAGCASVEFVKGTTYVADGVQQTNGIDTAVLVVPGLREGTRGPGRKFLQKLVYGGAYRLQIGLYDKSTEPMRARVVDSYVSDQNGMRIKIKFDMAIRWLEPPETSDKLLNFEIGSIPDGKFVNRFPKRSTKSRLMLTHTHGGVDLDSIGDHVILRYKVILDKDGSVVTNAFEVPLNKKAYSAIRPEPITI